MNQSNNGLPLTEIQQIVSEAETYNKNMEERGYHTGGPVDIEGVYDSRVYLLTCAVRALIGKVIVNE